MPVSMGRQDYLVLYGEQSINEIEEFRLSRCRDFIKVVIPLIIWLVFLADITRAVISQAKSS